MKDNLECEIQNVAKTTINVLGQLGPLVWSLHANQKHVIPSALCIDFEPNEYVIIGTDETIKKKKKRKDDVVQILQKLKQRREGDHPELFTSIGYRTAINRSIIVYAVTVLEHFLDTAKPLWKPKLDDEKWPADALGMICKLAGRSTKIDLRNLPGYKNTGWLILVRNAIIHCDGKAERAEADSVQYRLRKKDDTSPWRCDKWYTKTGNYFPILVWDDEFTEKPSTDWRDRAFSISIDHFILPRLQDVQAFVIDTEKRLVEALYYKR